MPSLQLPNSELEIRELTLRDGLHDLQLAVRSASIDVDARSFEAVVATETRATVFDWRSYENIDEILVASGGIFPETIPLLNDHMRRGVESMLGSATGFTRSNGQWVGRGTVGRAAEGNVHREQVWQDVRDGHLRAVSIGYIVRDYVDIPSGGKQRFGGKLYEAGDRALRVSTKWEVHELSLTPIGADAEALIRSARSAKPTGNERPQTRSYFAK